MLATQTMIGSQKKSKRERKSTGDSKDLASKPTTKASDGDTSSPSKRKQVEKNINAEAGHSEKTQKALVADDTDVVISSEGKKTEKNKKTKAEGKGKNFVIVDDGISKGRKITAEELPKPKPKKSRKGGDDSEPEVVLKPKSKQTSTKTKVPLKASSPEPEPMLSDDGHLYGFTSDDDDSSDEDYDIHDIPEPELGISKLPTIPKDDASVQRRIEAAKRQPVN